MLHGIREVESDVLSDKIANLESTHHSVGDKVERDTRISLTIRAVPKVLKTKLFFGKTR
jgi:alkylated DNA repair protein alkB family protein 6